MFFVWHRGEIDSYEENSRKIRHDTGADNALRELSGRRVFHGMLPKRNGKHKAGWKHARAENFRGCRVPARKTSVDRNFHRRFRATTRSSVKVRPQWCVTINLTGRRADNWKRAAARPYCASALSHPFSQRKERGSAERLVTSLAAADDIKPPCTTSRAMELPIHESLPHYDDGHLSRGHRWRRQIRYKYALPWSNRSPPPPLLLLAFTDTPAAILQNTLLQQRPRHPFP